MVFLGKQAIDDDANQTPQMVAALLGWGQGTYASSVTVVDNTVRVQREVDAGMEEIALTVPCVISTDLRLNAPRFPSLPNIMQAKQKPLQVIAVAQLALDLQTVQCVRAYRDPPVRAGGIIVPDVATLMDQLEKERGILG